MAEKKFMTCDGNCAAAHVGQIFLMSLLDESNDKNKLFFYACNAIYNKDID